jgi:iron complex transport system permease protein
MLLGGLLLMSADLIGRNIFMPQGLLAGIVVSIIGAPYFLYLVTKTQAS